MTPRPWEMKWLVVLALLSSCKARHDGEDVVRAPDPEPRGVAIDAAAVVDATAVDAAVDAMPEREARALRLRGYVELLSIDCWVYEDLAAFPGVPPGTTFVAGRFSWSVPSLMPRAEMVDKVNAMVNAASKKPRMAADEAVQAYAEVLARWFPTLLDLQQYYVDRRFVDDEFARGRRDGPQVAIARTELAARRVEMRAAVLAAWRELSADVPDSPRAIVGAAWETCVRFADHVMAGDKPEVLAAAVSACRRAIPAVAALPAEQGGGFAASLRLAAIDIGDHLANEYMSSGLATLSALTSQYLAAWPTLSTAPAERVPAGDAGAR